MDEGRMFKKVALASGMLQETVQDMGAELVEHAQQEAVPARGKLEELFPYIVIASKHMSARAISRWFEDKKNLKISAASVAKVIREKEGYCQKAVDRARIGANRLAEISEFESDAILTNENGEKETLSQEYAEILNGTDEQRARAHDLIIGLKMLNEWTILPEEIRSLCIEKCIKNKPKGEDEQ